MIKHPEPLLDMPLFQCVQMCSLGSTVSPVIFCCGKSPAFCCVVYAFQCVRPCLLCSALSPVFLSVLLCFMCFSVSGCIPVFYYVILCVVLCCVVSFIFQCHI